MRFDINEIEGNTLTPDANGVTWLVTEWDGWDTIPVQQQVGDMSGRHGGVLGASQWQAKPLSFTGIAKAPTENAYWAAREYFLAQTAFIYTTFPIRVYENYVKQMDVILGGGSSQRIAMVGMSAFQWELDCVALFPFKQNVIEQSAALSASFVVTNNGNADAYPVIEFVTGGSDIVMRNDTLDLSMKLMGAVPAGTVVDFRRLTVENGSSDLYSLIDPTEANWWVVQPGANTIEVSGGTGTLTFRDTWY